MKISGNITRNISGFNFNINEVTKTKLLTKLVFSQNSMQA